MGRVIPRGWEGGSVARRGRMCTECGDGGKGRRGEVGGGNDKDGVREFGKVGRLRGRQRLGYGAVWLMLYEK